MVGALPRLPVLALALAIASAAATAARPSDGDDGPGPRVTIAPGTLRGVVVRGAPPLRVFKGIAYAAPPTGDRRWRAPAVPASWKGVRRADAFGPACSQGPMAGPLVNPVAATSEDCLSLNVWTPWVDGGARLPVMVWVHGGAYLFGAASQRPYDGAALARRGVVVVTLNYRLGPFGFLAHPELSAEGQASSGNYAVLDVIAALRWVQEHIGAFGGDRDRVTVFGQSSGAGLVNALLVSPLASGLFARAILQSGSLLGRIQHLREGWYFQPPAEEIGVRVAHTVAPAGGVAVLRAATVDEVLAAANPQQPFSAVGNLFAPIVDGRTIVEEPAVSLEAGRFHRVPVLVGANADEGTAFEDLYRRATVASYQQLAFFAYGAHARDVLAAFPAPTDDAARVAVARSFGVAAFVAPARRLARAVARVGAPAYLYRFSRVRPGSVGARWGAFHASEVPFVFGTLIEADVPGIGHVGVAARDRALSDEMLSAWTRFAATGDPAGGAIGRWPAWDPAAPVVLDVGDVTRVRDDPCGATCDLFDAIARDWQRAKGG